MAEASGFQHCLDLVWQFDGLKNDAAPGETFPTTYGVTGATYDEGVRRGIVTNSFEDATKEDCANILHVMCWNATSCGLLNPGPSLLVFNDAVLAGCGHAVRLLQRIVGATEDGVMGPETRRLANSYDPRKLIEELKEADERFYKTLHNSALFLRGWTRREEFMALHAQAMVLI